MKKLNKKQYNDIINLAYLAMNSNPSLRFGQAVFNVTHDEYPELANSQRGTANDCFYHDHKVTQFLDSITETIIHEPI